MTDSGTSSYVTDKADTHSITNGELGMYRLPGGFITILNLAPGWRHNQQNMGQQTSEQRAQADMNTAEQLLSSAAGHLETGRLRIQLAGLGSVDLRPGCSFSFPTGSITDAEVIGNDDVRAIMFTPRWNTMSG